MMKLRIYVTAISIFLLLTTAAFIITPKETPTAATSLASVPSTIGTSDLSQHVSLDPSLDVRPLKKPKRGLKPREPETCSENSECFWNHRCVDGVCVVGCQDLKDCKPPQKCFNNHCHWKAFKYHGRPRRCSANKQKCLRNYHCCYHRCVLPTRRDLNTNTGIFGYCYTVPRGADGPEGDDWGDMRPDSGDMEELVDDGDTATAPVRFKGRDAVLEKRNLGLERRDLVAEAMDFDLEYGGEDVDEKDLDSQLIVKGKAAYWGDH